MTDAVVSRLGQNLASGDALALFRSIYLAEVLATFSKETVTASRHMVRTIENGKSATFPASGTASGGYHTPGAEILGRVTKHTEKVIAIDGMLESDSFIAEIDELMNHFDVRNLYARNQGIFLAKVWDENTLRLMALAARASANIPGVTPSGSVQYDADYKTDASKLAAGIFTARTTLDENGVPQSGVYAYLKPAQLALLVQNKDTINKDWNGSGSYADGSIAMIGGVPLVKTTNLPTQDLSDNTAITAAGYDPNVVLAKYRGDFSDTACVIASEEAVGTVKLKDLNVDVIPQPHRKGTLIVSSFVMGSGILRPECAVELQATTAP